MLTIWWAALYVEVRNVGSSRAKGSILNRGHTLDWPCTAIVNWDLRLTWQSHDSSIFWLIVSSYKGPEFSANVSRSYLFSVECKFNILSLSYSYYPWLVSIYGIRACGPGCWKQCSEADLGMHGAYKIYKQNICYIERKSVRNVLFSKCWQYPGELAVFLMSPLVWGETLYPLWMLHLVPTCYLTCCSACRIGLPLRMKSYYVKALESVWSSCWPLWDWRLFLMFAFLSTNPVLTLHQLQFRSVRNFYLMS